MEVPDETNPQVAVVISVRVMVVDVQTIAVEIADIDAVAVGVEIIAYFHPYH